MRGDITSLHPRSSGKCSSFTSPAITFFSRSQNFSESKLLQPLAASNSGKSTANELDQWIHTILSPNANSQHMLTSFFYLSASSMTLYESRCSTEEWQLLQRLKTFNAFENYEKKSNISPRKNNILKQRRFFKISSGREKGKDNVGKKPKLTALRTILSPTAK